MNIRLKPRRAARPYNTIMRWVDKPMRRLEHMIRTLARNAVVRHVEGVRHDGTQLLQTAGGGKTFGLGDDYNQMDGECPPLEQQGLASQLAPGARGLVMKPGCVPGTVVMLCARKQDQRPKYLQAWEICLYQPSGTRTYLTELGELRLETGLADYKEDGEDHDEGAKLRLQRSGVKGEAELYAEVAVELRSQAAGPLGPKATAKLEADGRATFEASSEDGSTYSRVTLNQDGSFEISADAGGGKTGTFSFGTSGDANFTVWGDVTVSSDGDVVINPAGKVKLGSGQMEPVALAEPVEDEIKKLVTAITGVTPVPNDGGAAIKTAVVLAFPSNVGSVASSSVEAAK